MCLAVPGRILRIYEADDTQMSDVDFGGVVKQVCLEYCPDVQIDDYVIVHVGFALQKLDEESALATLSTFENMGLLKEEFGDQFALAAHQAGIELPESMRNGATSAASTKGADR